jgi:acetate kinase
VDGRLLVELRRLTPYAPDHLPIELQLLEALRRRHPALPQVVCFDTAFHRTMPPVARALPLPRRYTRAGVQRYGFHGLSYQFLTEELGRLRDPAVRRGRVIMLHLGNGASLAAVRDGRSVDTSMGFTPAAGLVMGTRSGDLDPGLVAFLARERGVSPAAFDRMVNHDSGHVGVSGTSSDMRDLLARSPRDPRAALAVELFCYQARKWIGAYAAVLGGVDTVVFAGGIGENAPAVRARICAGLGFLGVRIDAGRNRRNAPVISRSGAGATVRVIPTDEELMIARSVRRLLRPGARAEPTP